MPAGGRARQRFHGQRFQSGGLTFARQSGDAAVRIGAIRLPAFRPLPGPAFAASMLAPAPNLPAGF